MTELAKRRESEECQDRLAGDDMTREDPTIQVPMATARLLALTPTLWQTYSWAPHWFRDALREARTTDTGPDARNARRREILFAVCFAESYLFEWVRDEALNRKFGSLEKCFPTRPEDGWGSTRDRWKVILRELQKDGVIPARPNLGGPHGEDWNRLLDYRNGLVHAGASRPKGGAQSEEQKPSPEPQELDQLQPGWALGVVIERVRRLHAKLGTAEPSWLAGP